MTVGKGFSSQKLLIRNWLVPENQEFYSFRNRSINIESLSATLNVWLAVAARRYDGSLDIKEESKFALSLIAELDEERLRDIADDNTWYAKIKKDDKFYLEYYRRLLDIVKSAVFSGQHSSLNGSIQSTWEYKQWMAEAGHLLVTPKLIDNWLHPLAQEKVVHQGKELIDLWMTASMIAATATSRHGDGSADKAINMLIELGVLDLEEDYQLRMSICNLLDLEYLKLISETKNALEERFDAIFQDKIQS